MNSIVVYKYDDYVLNCIEEQWLYGKNWPIVYIYYNDKYAYVGETIDAVNRVKQHRNEDAFEKCGFKYICLISNKTFNKSVALDLESFLIKHMEAEGKRKLINGNGGVCDHDYFYKEAYEDDFKEIWEGLLERKVVQKSLFDIENSELYKYSPYKSLNEDQVHAVHEIVNRLPNIRNKNGKTMIQVIGGAGTGKTILAVYLIKLLVDINNKENRWKYIDNPEEAEYIKWVSDKIGSIGKIGFVVPMKQLRATMKKLFKTIDGLNEAMIYSPKEAYYESDFDLLIVDEAHRLYKKNYLPGADLNITFNEINKELMAERFTGTEDDYTELDWIIKSSKRQILFYDEKQAIRSTDIGRVRFNRICEPYLSETIELRSQMRCQGGNGYYDYVRDVLFSDDSTNLGYKKIDNYEIKVTNTIKQLDTIISSKDAQCGLCKLLAGPAWSKSELINIDGKEYHWFDGKKDSQSIYSIHKIQGFDLNYAGVIFGKEVYYDKDKGSIEIDVTHLKDDRTKRDGEIEMRNYILNIYLTLMTRGIKGTYIYAENKALRDYLKKYLN